MGLPKNRVYINSSTRISNLKDRINIEMWVISPVMINKSIRSLQDRLYYWEETYEQFFEPL